MLPAVSWLAADPSRYGRNMLLIEMWERTRAGHPVVRQNLTTAPASAGILADGTSAIPKSGALRWIGEAGQEAGDACDAA